MFGMNDTSLTLGSHERITLVPILAGTFLHFFFPLVGKKVWNWEGQTDNDRSYFQTQQLPPHTSLLLRGKKLVRSEEEFFGWLSEVNWNYSRKSFISVFCHRPFLPNFIFCHRDHLKSSLLANARSGMNRIIKLSTAKKGSLDGVKSAPDMNESSRE